VFFWLSIFESAFAASALRWVSSSVFRFGFGSGLIEPEPGLTELGRPLCGALGRSLRVGFLIGDGAVGSFDDSLELRFPMSESVLVGPDRDPTPRGWRSFGGRGRGSGGSGGSGLCAKPLDDGGPDSDRGVLRAGLFAMVDNVVESQLGDVTRTSGRTGALTGAAGALFLLGTGGGGESAAGAEACKAATAVGFGFSRAAAALEPLDFVSVSPAGRRPRVIDRGE